MLLSTWRSFDSRDKLWDLRKIGKGVYEITVGPASFMLSGTEMNLIESLDPAVIFSCICKFCNWVLEITDGLSSPTAYIKFGNDDDTETKFLESPATFSGKGILMEKIEAPLKEINKIRRTDRTAKKDFFLFPIALLSEDMIFLKDSWFCVHGFCIVEKVNSRRVW
ncbi:hypothetical protein R6Q59_026694 [Mikania micrantha]